LAPAAAAVGAALVLFALVRWRGRALEADALDMWQARLTSLSDAKKLALESWLGERRGAAAIVAEYARTRFAPVGRPWSAVQQLSRFERLWVVTGEGDVVGRSDSAPGPGSALLAAAVRTARDGRSRIEGPLRGPDGALALVFTAPVLVPAATGGAAPASAGAVVLTMDPAEFLLPQVAHQPLATTTGQCYLVGRDADDLVLLTPRQHPAATALSVRERWEAATLPDRLAADGTRTFGVYSDASGVPVLAATRRIAPTGWGLVCRVDRWEALAAVTARERNEVVLVLSVLAAAMFGLLWTVRRADLRRETERRLASDALAAAERRFHTVVEHSLAGFYIIRDERFDYVNPELARMFGYTVAEVLALPSVLDVVAEEDRETVRQNVRQQLEGAVPSLRYTFRGRRRNGSYLDVEVHGTGTVVDGRIVVIGTLLDLTDRRLLEQQLRQAQKMEAVGQLAGGMAHDFNNLLSSILATVELARQDLPPESPLLPDLEVIQHAGQRGADLTRKLLAFSRRQRLEFQTVDLAQLVGDFARVLRRMVREDVQIEVDVAPAGTTVRADPGAIEQMVMNLVTNARDAMPAGGRLTIGVAPATLDAAACAELGMGTPGEYVALRVTDSGVGMDEATRARVFEPFFTTKEVGAGTGLGLAMVYGLVKQHKGWVFVASAPGRGTTVSLYLPVGDGLGGARTTPAAPLPAGKETILLVEDEESLLRVGKRLLERHGYNVLTAADGMHALELVRQHADGIDLLIADVVMPRLGGPGLYREMVREGRHLRVLFTSGYAGRETEGVPLDPGLPFVQKPWTVSEFLRKVREALDAGPPAPPAD
jgi:PAS domain S-box-containing protein